MDDKGLLVMTGNHIRCAENLQALLMMMSNKVEKTVRRISRIFSLLEMLLKLTLEIQLAAGTAERAAVFSS